MILPGTTNNRWKILVGIVVIGTIVTAVSLNWPRGDAFGGALGP